MEGTLYYLQSQRDRAKCVGSAHCDKGKKIDFVSSKTFLKNHFNPLTPMCDQNRISPNYIYTISYRQVMRIEKKFNCGITNWFDTKFF